MKKNNQDKFIKQAMDNVMLKGHIATTPIGEFNRASIAINHDSLSRCLVALAHLVNQDGDVYLPIFERIKQELDQHSHLEQMKGLAMHIVEQSNGNHHFDSESLH